MYVCVLSLGTLTAGIGNIQSKAAEGVQPKRSLSADAASELSLTILLQSHTHTVNLCISRCKLPPAECCQGAAKACQRFGD